MRRMLLTPLLVVAALAAAAPSAVAAPAARARLAECRQGLEQGDRYAVFTASIRPRRAGDRMAVRFELLRRRLAERSFSRVQAPGLGNWNRAKRGVPAYRFRQRVENLSAPAAYRARVSFRWSDGTTERRLTGICRQPDLRPDLEVALVSIAPAGPAQADYTVAVRNAGRTHARGDSGFDVALRVAGLSRPAVTVAGLGPGERRLVTFRAPRCGPGAAVEALVDPDGRVEESDEADGRFVSACPTL